MLCIFHVIFIFMGLYSLYLQQFLLLYIQTLHNDCSHIEDVCLSFCANMIIFYYILKAFELRYFPFEILRGCLVFIICNSNS